MGVRFRGRRNAPVPPFHIRKFDTRPPFRITTVCFLLDKAIPFQKGVAQMDNLITNCVLQALDLKPALGQAMVNASVSTSGHNKVKNSNETTEVRRDRGRRKEHRRHHRHRTAAARYRLAINRGFDTLEFVYRPQQKRGAQRPRAVACRRSQQQFRCSLPSTCSQALDCRP